MWSVIFAVSIMLAVAAFVYVAALIARALGRGKASFKSTLAAFVGLGLLCWLGAMALDSVNMVICLFVVAVCFALCHGVFAVLRLVTKRTFSPKVKTLIALILAAIYLSVGLYQDYHVTPVFYQITSDKIAKPVRILLFADSHIGTTFDAAGFARHVESMKSYAPDIVAIVGDFVDDGTNRSEMLKSAQALRAFAPVPVYFVFGNHDKGYYNPAVRGFTGADLIDALQQNNVIVLQDEVKPALDAIYIIGRNDASEKYRGGHRAPMTELAQNLPLNALSVVLDHQPNDYKAQANAQVDLVLSGHTHGGQLSPLNKVGEWIGANDKTYGIEKRGKTNFIVTSGLSDWAIKFKTGTQSEFVIIDIIPSSNGGKEK